MHCSSQEHGAAETQPSGDNTTTELAAVWGHVGSCVKIMRGPKTLQCFDEACLPERPDAAIHELLHALSRMSDLFVSWRPLEPQYPCMSLQGHRG